MRRVDILADLNEPQRAAVVHVDGPLLVLAGAGSGKTRVITRRVAYLIRQGVSPWSILAITFTNKAAGEMLQRVEALRAPRGATICTFHSLCARLLREFSAEAGLAGNYSIYDRDDQIRLVKEAMANLDLASSLSLTPGRVHGLISHAKNELRSAEAFAESGEEDFNLRRVAKVFAEYERLLAKNNALDFDDLLLRMARLLRDRPGVRELLARRYRYVLVDEYQDTNRAQYVIAHGIASGHENICVTGDPDQSIYAWRGADIRNIMEFEADYPKAVVVRLEENYRSTAPILAAASRLIGHNTMRKRKALWTRRQGGAAVRVVCCDDERAEAAEVAARIAAHAAAGGRLDEAAVFYRVNSLSRVLEEAFRREKLAYRIARGVEFYNRKEIKDALAYLKLLVNGADDLSCLRIINTPARGIGASTVAQLTKAAAQRPTAVLDLCRTPAEAKLSTGPARKVAAFAELIDSLAKRLDRPVRETIEDVLDRSGLEAAMEDRGEEDAQRLANLAELVTTAAEFDRDNPGAPLAEFLHQVALVSDVDRFEGATGAVTFMTLHAAKGLEFPLVFMVGCEDGLLPIRRRDEDERRTDERTATEEERRLAFVGMTRAKDELTLLWARERMVRGFTSPQAASPFLHEIGSDGVEWLDRTSEDDEEDDLPAPPVFRRRGWLQRRTGGRGGGRGRGGFYADASERRAIESAADADEAEASAPAEGPPCPPEYRSLRVNSRIRHPKFGQGTVIALRNRWPDTRADIHFDDAGAKTIVLKYAKLDVVEEWT